MTQPTQLLVFATRPHPCGYLPEQQATTLFVDPDAPMDAELYEQLTLIGFRRSGSHVYRPHCSRCRACISARIPVADFAPNRSQRRLFRRNRNLRARLVEDLEAPEYYRLYERYLCARHRDGDMYPPSSEQFHDFLGSQWQTTRYVRFDLEDSLLAVAVIDLLDRGLSAIYTFYDPAPEHSVRSLGTYAILWQVEWARQLGLDDVYLGYWIRNCPRMSYKSNFRPLELLLHDRWVRMDASSRLNPVPD